MKRFMLITPALLLLVLAANAQNKPATASKTNTTAKGAATAVVPPTKVDKTINRATNAVNSANNSVNNAGVAAKNAIGAARNTANQVHGVTSKMDSLFGPKNTTPGTAVTIKIPGATRARIKELCEIIKTCPSVNAKDLDYDAEQQNITIATYKGKLNDLLDEIEKKTVLVTDSNASVSKVNKSITITGL